MKNTILIVGASSFIGKHLVSELISRGQRICITTRKPLDADSELTQIINNSELVEIINIPDLTSLECDWTAILHDVGGIVYLAARVHVMNDNHPDPLVAYRAVNKDAPLHLAKIAAQTGVKRFVYLSSVKVMGESSKRPLTEMDLPNPTDPYGASKLEAEDELLALSRTSGLEVSILRPPLVYGFGVKANFMRLVKLVSWGVPIPIGAINNKRSMIYVENLVDAIVQTLQHPNAVNQVFLVSDGEDLSTPELVRQLAIGYDKVAWLPNVPIRWLKTCAKLLNRTSEIQRLAESLQVSTTKIQTTLGWVPPFTVSNALLKTVKLIRSNGVKYHNQRVKKYALTPIQNRYLKVRTVLEKIPAAMLLFLLSPILLMLCVLIKLDSAGSIFFIQERVGRKGKTFKCFKFRTMKMGTPNISTEEMQKIATSPITKIGHVLRRTSLDELPQILNILLGEMSFVGPRPALPRQDFVVLMRKNAGVDHLYPGITGLAQVRGRDNLSDEQKVKFDMEYLNNFSLLQDVNLLLATFFTVVSGHGNR